MTKHVYKTALGHQIDMGALILRNEQERAVGNMNVNARGDIVDPQNRPISSRTEQVRQHYARQTNVSHSPVTVSKNKEEGSQ